MTGARCLVEVVVPFGPAEQGVVVRGACAAELGHEGHHWVPMYSTTLRWEQEPEGDDGVE